MKRRIKQIEYKVLKKKRTKLNKINKNKFIASINHAKTKQ